MSEDAQTLWSNSDKLHTDTIIALKEIRDEEAHVLNLINGLIDKVLDLSKLLITVSVTALIALMTVSETTISNKSGLLLGCLAIAIISFILFVSGILWKSRHLPSYIKSSTHRLETYTVNLEYSRLRHQFKKEK